MKRFFRWLLILPLLAVTPALMGPTGGPALTEANIWRQISAEKCGFKTNASAATNVTALQACIDRMDTAGGGKVLLNAGSFNFNAAITLRDGVSIAGKGPFATILNYTGTGTAGFQSTSGSPSGIEIRDLQLNGDSTANAAEDGIRIVGDSSGGVPKLVLSNLLVRNWGDDGVYCENCFDATIEYVNASSNADDGFEIVSSFAIAMHKNVTFQNDGNGFHITRAAGSFFSGNAQENALNGWLIETAQGCTFTTYMEQNGHGGAGATAAQFRLTQASGGFNVSSGNELNVFALGGNGGGGFESEYGVYIDFAEDNEVNGSFGGHNTNDILLTSNSSRNTSGTVKYITVSGTPTPTPLVNNGANFIPSKVYEVQADAGSGNTGAGEDNLKTFSLPADTLYLNEQALEVIAYGNTGNNVNNKRVRCYFGATTIIDTGTAAAQARDWEFRAVVVRLSNTSQHVITRGTWNNAFLASDFTAPAETLSGAVLIRCTGEGVADNDLVQRGLIVKALN